MAYAVYDKDGKLRYFWSEREAEKKAKQYGTIVYLCFNVPTYLIEEIKR